MASKGITRRRNKKKMNTKYYVDRYSPGTTRDLRGPLTEESAQSMRVGVEVSVKPNDGVVSRLVELHPGAHVSLVEVWAESEDSEGYSAIYCVQDVDARP